MHPQPEPRGDALFGQDPETHADTARGAPHRRRGFGFHLLEPHGRRSFERLPRMLGHFKTGRPARPCEREKGHPKVAQVVFLSSLCGDQKTKSVAAKSVTPVSSITTSVESMLPVPVTST